MRARKSAAPRPDSTGAASLQRGRACEGAEIERSLIGAAKCHKLQRGRACEGAEIGSSAAGAPIALRLQRGRACEGAEI